MKKEARKNSIRLFEWLALASMLPLILAPSAFAARVIGFSQMQFGEDLSLNSSTLNFFAVYNKVMLL